MNLLAKAGRAWPRSSVVAPIHLKPHAATLPFRGGQLQVRNRAALVDAVAKLLLGHHLHVEQILAGAMAPPIRTTPNIVKAAIARVETPQTDVQRWHRDGWVFQMISWLAVRSESPQCTVVSPQMAPTRQGFDCVFMELEDKNDPRLTICEDKATDSARDVVRDEVFPAFAECETGVRDAELQAVLTSLVRQGRPDTEVEAAIASVQWAEHKQYRATVTAPPQVANEPQKLFKGFDDHVAGDVERRTGHVFPVAHLRPWMDAFCADLRAALLTIPTSAVVTGKR